MDGVGIKLFGKIDFGIQTTWDMRTDIYICPWEILHFLAVDLGRGTKFGDFIFFAVDFTKGEWR